MKIGFIIPILDEYDLDVAFKNIDKACKDSEVNYEILFALNHNMGQVFTKIRNLFVENDKIKAFMTDRMVDEHKLITLAMLQSEKYDAVIIYSGKEETNVDVMKAFISSYKAGNKIVYLKKVYRGFAKFTQAVKQFFYRLGLLMLGIFKDVCAENDIQLLDEDVVKTINQLPAKNQLLRTLDSLIYYATDIIHLEVDPNEFINPVYLEKSRSEVANTIGLWISLGVSLLMALTSILIAAFVSINFLFHLLFWSACVVSFFLFVVFATKKVLAKRVGQLWDETDIKSVKAKTEYYNF